METIKLDRLQSHVELRATVDLADVTMRTGTWMQIRIPIAPGHYGIIEIQARVDGQVVIYATNDLPAPKSFDEYEIAEPTE
ncbi:MAG: hypothetical protein WC455_19000 [Dehalococcoidia bacterium]|jgi:hypothetical protein